MVLSQLSHATLDLLIEFFLNHKFAPTCSQLLRSSTFKDITNEEIDPWFYIKNIMSTEFDLYLTRCCNNMFLKKTFSSKSSKYFCFLP